MGKTVQKGYVCRIADLDKLLNEELRSEFRSLFYDESGVLKDEAWRIGLGGLTPNDYFSRYGIDFDKPRVRDAVAMDMIKLDDDSVSNDSVYTFDEHQGYSSSELERFLLHKNFRINLVNLEKDWTKIRYTSGQVELKRTIEKWYQGVVLSETMLSYFNNVFDTCFNSTGEVKFESKPTDVQFPFTNPNDFTTEISLIPNNRHDFQSMASRSYYDMKYEEYKQLMNKYNIYGISSFALVDAKRGKTHTGKYLVKVVKKIYDVYDYIIAMIDKDGQINGVQVYASAYNTIISVCENDFKKREDGISILEWTPVKRDMSRILVQSTTSSHYSVFRQRIPGYDLKYVRNYIQFKTRLEGMELCLEQLKRNIESKRSQCSSCFIKQISSIHNLFKYFKMNKDMFSDVMEFYKLIREYDYYSTQKIQIEKLIDEKNAILDELREQYNSKKNNELEQKYDLGNKIKSIRFEISKTLKTAVDEKNAKLNELREQFKILNHKITGVEDSDQVLDIVDTTELHQLVLETEKQMGYMFNLGYELEYMSRIYTIAEDATIKVRRLVNNFKERIKNTEEQVFDSNHYLKKDVNLINIDSAGLRDIILLHDWYACNAGENTYQDMGFKDALQFLRYRQRCNEKAYSLRRNQYAQLLAGRRIKLQDLVDTLRGRIDGRNLLQYDDKYGRDGLKDEKKPWTIDDVTPEQEQKIRIFTQMVHAIKIPSSVQNISSSKQKSTISSDILSKAINNIRNTIVVKSNIPQSNPNNNNSDLDVFVIAKHKLEQEDIDNALYEQDSLLMWQRTIDYLKYLGIIENEDDLVKLVMRSNSMNSTFITPQEATRKINNLADMRNSLFESTQRMNKHRQTLQSLIDNVKLAESKIQELKTRNSQIFNSCLTETNRQIRNRLLLDKIDNENKIVELQQTVDKIRSDNLQDFSALENMRNQVDVSQIAYDNAVRQFKDDIGINQDTINSLVVQIYNLYQQEIIEHSEETKDGNA